MIPNFQNFLESKPLYYKKIDTQRICEAYSLLKDRIKHPPAVHIVGTNGKGSTGRMIAHLAYRAMVGGPSSSPPLVGHYSSPHILRLNERFWIDGLEVSDEKLEAAHRRLYEILGAQLSQALSYFEYSTLLALLLFEECDLIVIEAGLGGEFDATNVLENRRLSVVTPIGLDHQAFLGSDIKSVARTKCESFRQGSLALLASQPYEEAQRVAKEIAAKKGVRLVRVEDSKYKIENVRNILKAKVWPKFLLENALVALEALELLGIEGSIEELNELELFGRFYPISENIRIDVGHNPLAARAIVEALEPQSVLIYNSLDDKDYKEVLATLKPKLKRVDIIAINNQRAATLQKIEEALKELEIPWSYYDGLLFSHENYLVFGSFYTVEAFLKSQEIKA